MGQTIVLTGMVLQTMPMGDYDKRLTILTKERGKITAFAKGARRPNSQLLAAANPFCYGEFELFEGRTTYTLVKATVANYFRDLLNDLDSVYYGFYFLELASYYTQENNDERQMLKLLYQSLRALQHPSLNNRLVKVICELRVLVVNGEYPNVFSCMKCGKKEDLCYFSVKYRGTLCKDCGTMESGILLNESVLYTLQYIISVELKKLYTFTVTEQVLLVLEQVMGNYWNSYIPHHFKSLEILNQSPVK